MVGYNMGTVESYFADIVWEREPLSTSELIEICKEKFNWKRTTTYTVLKRLCEGGVFKLENSTVTSLISRENFYSAKSESFVEESFNQDCLVKFRSLNSEGFHPLSNNLIHLSFCFCFIIIDYRV